MQGAVRAREALAGLQRGHREFLVAVRGPGQFVGEMAAFAAGALRCASVRARGPLRAAVVPGELLRATVERVPEVRAEGFRVLG
jgi:CRP-like cAMP-binding protein